ncbi:MAG: PrgI family protein [Eggerthellaceae bacterium]|nr:PrgI family protein [Eggerthellaceae bacterium]
MLSVPVRKDISEYKSKVIGQLTARTLITIVIALTVAVSLGVILQLVLGISWTYAQWPIYLSAFGIWALGLWRPYGMPLERYIPLWIQHNLKSDQCVYVSTPSRLKGKANEASEDQLSKTYARLSKTRGIEACAFSEEVAELD